MSRASRSPCALEDLVKSDGPNIQPARLRPSKFRVEKKRLPNRRWPEHSCCRGCRSGPFGFGKCVVLSLTNQPQIPYFCTRGDDSPNWMRHIAKRLRAVAHRRAFQSHRSQAPHPGDNRLLCYPGPHHEFVRARRVAGETGSATPSPTHRRGGRFCDARHHAGFFEVLRCPPGHGGHQQTVAEPDAQPVGI